MKNMFKLGSSFMLAILLMITTMIPISANENDTIGFQAPDSVFYIETDYNKQDFGLRESTNFDKVSYTVYNKKTGVDMEAWDFPKTLSRSNQPRRSFFYIHKTYLNFGNSNLSSLGHIETTVSMEVYTSGSFGQINQIYSVYSGIVGNSTPLSITSQNDGSWVADGKSSFPAPGAKITKVINVGCTISVSFNASHKAGLVSAGYNVSQNRYTSRVIRQAYTIKTMRY